MFELIKKLLSNDEPKSILETPKRLRKAKVNQELVDAVFSKIHPEMPIVKSNSMDVTEAINTTEEWLANPRKVIQDGATKDGIVRLLTFVKECEKIIIDYTENGGTASYLDDIYNKMAEKK